MVNFTNFNRIATAAVGSLLISTAFIAAAVGPATNVGQTPAATHAAVQSPAQASTHA